MKLCQLSRPRSHEQNREGIIRLREKERPGKSTMMRRVSAFWRGKYVIRSAPCEWRRDDQKRVQGLEGVTAG